MSTLPKSLLDQISQGRIVLFLGSGSSHSARHPQGKKPPLGDDLSKMLAETFLGPEYFDKPLSQVANYAINDMGLGAVQRYIAELFKPFQPNEQHLVLPTFRWHSIFTTNYDRVLEQAYLSTTEKLQELTPFIRNGESIEETLRHERSVPYYKLHGCITCTDDPLLPLILTPEQYISHRKNRSRLFERLQSAACEFPILFIGHSLDDIDIRTILDELEVLGTMRPMSYIVAPDMLPGAIRYWSSRRYECISMTFDDFVARLDSEIDSRLRPLSQRHEIADQPIRLQFKAPSSEFAGSPELWDALKVTLLYVHAGMASEEPKPSSFYSGFCADFGPIIQNIDVRRQSTDDILSEVMLREEAFRSDVAELVVIKAHAGAGKTVFLRRIAFEAATRLNTLCLWHVSGPQIRFETLRELNSLLGQRVFVFIDPISECLDWFEPLLVKCRREKLPISFVAVERTNEWNTDCERLHSLVTDSYDLKYLNESEIVVLLGLLTKYGCLGYLKELPIEKQLSELSHKAGRQLLVALYEATHGKAFSDIIVDEFNSISGTQARSLYLTVSILHRLGVKTRAGLISRVHNIPFNEFKEHLFKPLENIVFARFDDLIHDYVYVTRHPVIANMVFEGILKDVNERFDEYVRIVTAADVDYSADREGFYGLVNARELLQLFPDPPMVRQLYTIAHGRANERAPLLQQEAIYEMKCPGGSTKRASELLAQARQLAPRNLPILHSCAELDFRLSFEAETDVERAKHRKQASDLATEIIDLGTVSPHAYHTLLKLGLVELKEELDSEDEGAVQRRIKSIENQLARAIQRFPTQGHILDIDAEFAELMDQHPRALKSLESAFKLNPRSSFIALRLARTYVKDGREGDAIGILETCLEANPADKYVNFQLSMLLLRSDPSRNELIEHHLRRSFTNGDNNYAAQFWYARQLYLSGKMEEANTIYRLLRNARADSQVRNAPQGAITDKSGATVRFEGTVDSKEASYLFVLRDGPRDRLFCHISNSRPEQWEKCRLFTRVSFEIWFTYSGAAGVDLVTLNNY